MTEFKIHQSERSINFSQTVITPLFGIIHYTGVSLKKTLQIFQSPQPGITSHFILDADGSAYDLGGFLKGSPLLAGAHAGKSVAQLDGKKHEGLNQCSIGIEIINLNGNLYPYPERQIQGLCSLVKKIIHAYPTLVRPEVWLGHEHIAGFRGKCDPGLMFPWPEFFKNIFPAQTAPARLPVLDPKNLEWLKNKIPSSTPTDDDFWMNLGTELERKLAQDFMPK